jgi:hypothetical protein
MYISESLNYKLLLSLSRISSSVQTGQHGLPLYKGEYFLDTLA